MKTFRAIQDKLLVQMDKRQEATASGIIIAAVARTIQQEGTVRSAGDGCKHVKEGDKVIPAPHAGTEYHANGEDFLIIDEAHILAIVE